MEKRRTELQRKKAVEPNIEDIEADVEVKMMRDGENREGEDQRNSKLIVSKPGRSD